MTFHRVLFKIKKFISSSSKWYFISSSEKITRWRIETICEGLIFKCFFSPYLLLKKQWKMSLKIEKSCFKSLCQTIKEPYFQYNLNLLNFQIGITYGKISCYLPLIIKRTIFN